MEYATTYKVHNIPASLSDDLIEFKKLGINDLRSRHPFLIYHCDDSFKIESARDGEDFIKNEITFRISIKIK